MAGNGWMLKSIDELKAPTTGAIAIGPFGSRMKSDCYVPSGVQVIRGTNISDTRTLVGEMVCITPQLADQLGNAIVHADDLVFPHRGSIGLVGIVPRNNVERFALSSSLMKLTCDRKQVEPLFLFYFFRSDDGRHELLKNASTVGTPGIGQPLSSLRSIRVPLPPLAEQKAIAAVLGALDDKIELNRRMNATLEAMARTLFQSWFVDFDPVRAKLDGRRPAALDPATAALFPDCFHETTCGHIPAGWQLGRLGDLCNLKRGHDLPTNTRTAGPIPVISSSGISGTHSDTKVQGPGVVTGRYGTIGKVFYVETDYWPLNTTLFVDDFKRNPPRFIFHALGEVNFQNYTDKAAVPGVNRNHLHEEPTVLPPMELRQAFAIAVSPLWSQHAANERQSHTLATLRDTLLPKLLSGEISANAVGQ
jgi:type I restriction enzyme S subunit